MSEVERQRPALRQHCDLQPSPHRDHQTGQNSTSSANPNPFIFSFIVIVSLHTFLIFLQVALLVLSYWLHPRDFFRSEHGFVSFKHQHNLVMWWWWVEWGGGVASGYYNSESIHVRRIPWLPPKIWFEKNWNWSWTRVPSGSRRTSSSSSSSGFSLRFFVMFENY